jgi:alkanesulfonate monooxygenase SsuD/methylene tetrahydromethanopterin reductase-like flavin-dependent oxidoreductase (luciferase family)
LEPKPVQERLPLVVGGGGEKVTLRIAAQHADGWNLAFTSPETYRQKVEALAGHCGKFDRDPASITKSVNLALAWKEDDLVRQFGGTAEFIGVNALKGSAQQVIDRIGEYRDAGADMVILALRAPFDVDGLDRFAAEILPAFA